MDPNFFHRDPGAVSQMTEVPVNRMSQMAKFKQTEKVHKITVFFDTSKFTVEVKN